MQKDSATIKAKKEGLRARSAFKLKEIQKKYKIISKGNIILDLGAWPGGWSIIASKYGQVYGIDLTNMDSIHGVNFVKGDVNEDSWLDEIPKLDVVLSDMAPKTTGNRERDQYDSFLLCERALEICSSKLKSGGNFVCKIFQGPEYEEFLVSVRSKFDFVKSYKPPTSKSKSKEMYIIGRGFKV
jgi:23S rRNA (uridine2552-2'-O)-methyltransferase